MAQLPLQNLNLPSAIHTSRFADVLLFDKKKKSKKKKKDKKCCKSYKKKEGKMCKDCPKLDKLKKSLSC